VEDCKVVDYEEVLGKRVDYDVDERIAEEQEVE
jgi:hypothetical protein